MAAQRERIAGKPVRLAEEGQEGEPDGRAAEAAVLEEEGFLPWLRGGWWWRRWWLRDEKLEFASWCCEEVACDVWGEID
jgi:hypothetical protein